MLLNQLKAHRDLSDPVTKEFVVLMDATFRYYGDTRALFFEKLPQHLLQSELISLVNVEIKNRLFDERFCEGIQDSLKLLRRAIIRLEDLRALHPDLPAVVNDLVRLSALAERVEALYQRHWEYYRYKGRINEEELVGFLLEIEEIGSDWDIYLSATASVHSMLESLHGQPCPEGMEPLRITFQREAQHHFAIATIRSLIGFLEVGYRFICAVGEIDPAETPLSLLQVEVGHPVEVLLAVPKAFAHPYRRFLQYLFLKDMLKREGLLKLVFEAARRDMGREKPLAPTVLTGFQRDLNAQLKQLPEDGRFTISDRTFPDDGIRVLQEFTSSLDEKNIRYDSLLRGESAKERKTRMQGKPKPDGLLDLTIPAPESPPPPEKRSPDGDGHRGSAPRDNAPGGKAREARERGTLFHPLTEKEHIGLLTEKNRNR